MFIEQCDTRQSSRRFRYIRIDYLGLLETYFSPLTCSCTWCAATFNYCSVPLRGYDAFLFVSLALLATSILFGKLSAVFVLIFGGIIGLLNYYVNLLQISNAISLWLSIQPADLFFYAFLPPLLVEQAIRIDFFMFRKIWVHALLMAFVMVVLSAIALTPIILFVLGFQSRGWSWVHGALFSAIISPTDALAVAAILARANGPERLVAVMEGECLFNDASAITLFEVFAHLIYTHTSTYPEVWPSVWSVIPTILLDITRLSVIGVAIGLSMSWVTWHLLRWLRWRGARPYIETTVILAVAYLSFYVTNSPARGSGVIAVVVFGLYGNATSKWGMLASAEESGAFDAVWDMISFSANGLVFFWSGVASINFFVRSVTLLERTAWSYAAIPAIYVFMLLIRCGCVALFNPLFRWLGEGLSAAEIFFVGFAGLRGSVSLIMVSSFATGTRLSLSNPDESTLVNADISLWSSAFVVLTLIINGPLIAPILKLLKLDTISVEKLKMRSRAKRALCRYTEQQLTVLRDDDDEFLQGTTVISMLVDGGALSFCLFCDFIYLRFCILQVPIGMLLLSMLICLANLKGLILLRRSSSPPPPLLLPSKARKILQTPPLLLGSCVFYSEVHGAAFVAAFSGFVEKTPQR